jgi:subtilisin family serine protease
VKSGYEVCNGASWTFDTTQILDGISYIVQKAAELKMRVVISLSLGGNIGAHDGTDPFERALDAFVAEGAPVVVAAGNAAQDQDHIDGQITQGENTTFQLSFRESTTDVAVDIWYSSQDQLSGTLYAPDGTSYPAHTLSGSISTNFGQVNATEDSPPNGNEIYFEVNSTTNNPLPLSGWSVSLIGEKVHSQGLWNAWTDSETCSFPGSFFLPGEGYTVDSQDTIGIPATAENVVSVGAYVTKTYWIGMDGKTYGRPDLSPGDIASFSSLGPTRDGRIKPDVVAPGELIVSARSSAIPKDPSDPDAYHRVLAGTSMATPHVAGVIALMLQYAPNLHAVDVPEILRRSARLDSFTGLISGGSATWGFGKVDARTATGLSRQTFVIYGIPSTVAVPLHVNGSRTIMVQGGSWTDFYFPKDTHFVVSFDHQVKETGDMLYELQSENVNGTANPVFSLNYTAVYKPTPAGTYDLTFIEILIAVIIADLAVMIYARKKLS